MMKTTTFQKTAPAQNGGAMAISETARRVLQIVHMLVQKSLLLTYPWIVRALPLRVEDSDVTNGAMIELTSKCNLRCVYCGKSSDPKEMRRRFDFPEEKILPSILFLRDRGLREVCMSGIGETTTRKGWDRICRKTLDTGVAHTIITNLARPLSGDEAETLARFGSIQVSVDTADPELFAKLRRGSELPTVLANMERIRDAARNIGVRKLDFRFDIVVTDKTVHGLVETVKLGLRNGVTEFYFAGLYKMRDAVGAVNVYHVKSLPQQELVGALWSLESAINLARESGCKVQVHDGLIKSIKRAIAVPIPGNAKEIRTPPDTERSWDAPPLEPGFTRDCLDPWIYVFLYAQGEVRPCCAYDKGIGNTNQNTLQEILNGSSVKEIRRNLLSGSLKGMMCAHCSMRNPIQVESFRRKVKGLRLVGMSYRFLGKKTTDWLIRATRTS